MAPKAPTIIAIVFLLASILHAGDAGNLPDKNEDWGQPKTIYVFDATCHECIDAAKEGVCIYYHLRGKIECKAKTKKGERP